MNCNQPSSQKNKSAKKKDIYVHDQPPTFNDYSIGQDINETNKDTILSSDYEIISKEYDYKPLKSNNKAKKESILSSEYEVVPDVYDYDQLKSNSQDTILQELQTKKKTMHKEVESFDQPTYFEEYSFQKESNSPTLNTYPSTNNNTKKSKSPCKSILKNNYSPTQLLQANFDNKYKTPVYKAIEEAKVLMNFEEVLNKNVNDPKTNYSTEKSQTQENQSNMIPLYISSTNKNTSLKLHTPTTEENVNYLMDNFEKKEFEEYIKTGENTFREDEPTLDINSFIAKEISEPNTDREISRIDYFEIDSKISTNKNEILTKDYIKKVEPVGAFKKTSTKSITSLRNQTNSVIQMQKFLNIIL